MIMETIMKTHADGFQTDVLTPKTDIGPATAANPTLCWQLRDGVLVQVWRVAEGASHSEVGSGLPSQVLCDREAA
jgi:hypothetical protein